MSGQYLEAFQQAIYGVLDGDATLGAMVGGVYDRVPEGSAYPYLVFGDGRSRDVQAIATEDEDISLRIEVYSRSGGRKEALGIVARVHDVLDDQTISLGGGLTLVWISVQDVSVQMRADGLTWRGVMDVRARVRG